MTRPLALLLLLAGPLALAGCSETSTYWVIVSNEVGEPISYAVLTGDGDTVCDGELPPHPKPGDLSLSAKSPAAFCDTGLSYFSNLHLVAAVTYLRSGSHDAADLVTGDFDSGAESGRAKGSFIYAERNGLWAEPTTHDAKSARKANDL